MPQHPEFRRQLVSRAACLCSGDRREWAGEENAFFVIEHIEGADKIGIVFAGEAFRGCAVAFGTVIREDFCAASYGGGVFFGSGDRSYVSPRCWLYRRWQFVRLARRFERQRRT